MLVRCDKAHAAWVDLDAILGILLRDLDEELGSFLSAFVNGFVKVGGKLAHDRSGVDQSVFVKCHLLLEAASIVNRKFRWLGESPVPPLIGHWHAAIFHRPSDCLCDSPLADFLQRRLAILDEPAGFADVLALRCALAGWFPKGCR